MGETYEREKGIPADQAKDLIPVIHAFISQYQVDPTFLLTFKKDGMPRMRPVSTFVEGWTVGTITQDLHVKTNHIRRNPVVGYLWVGGPGPRGNAWTPKNVFLQGKAELIEDADQIADFFARRKAATGMADAHPTDHHYRRILIKTTPMYLRAEGFAEEMRPVIITDFSNL